MGAGGRERTEDTARGARGPGWRELAGTFNWPDGGSVADGHRQVGSGMARNRARARLTFSCHGQLLGRWRVSRRAERVIRPTRAKTLRRRVLVVTIRSPRPMRAVQRAMSRAAAKRTTVVSKFRINVRPSVQHKCHLGRLPWYQMLTSWAQPEVAALVGPQIPGISSRWPG